MASEFGFRLTQRAQADLEEILRHIAVELANPSAAAAWIEKILSAIGEARIFPESGAPVNNEFLPNIGVRKKSVGNYLIYYLPSFEEKQILVLRIVYGRRNVDEILRNLGI